MSGRCKLAEVIDPQSFRYVERPDYPIWRWITAPIEVLWGPDAVTIITIIMLYGY